MTTFVDVLLYLAENRAPQKQIDGLPGAGAVCTVTSAKVPSRGRAASHLPSSPAQERGPKATVPNTNSLKLWCKHLPLNPLRHQRGFFSNGALGGWACCLPSGGAFPSGAGWELTPLLLPRQSATHQDSATVCSFSSQNWTDSRPPVQALRSSSMVGWRKMNFYVFQVQTCRPSQQCHLALSPWPPTHRQLPESLLSIAALPLCARTPAEQLLGFGPASVPALNASVSFCGLLRSLPALLCLMAFSFLISAPVNLTLPVCMPITYRIWIIHLLACVNHIYTTGLFHSNPHIFGTGFFSTTRYRNYIVSHLRRLCPWQQPRDKREKRKRPRSWSSLCYMHHWGRTLSVVPWLSVCDIQEVCDTHTWCSGYTVCVRATGHGNSGACPGTCMVLCISALREKHWRTDIVSTTGRRGDRIMSGWEQKAKGVILQKVSGMQNAWYILYNQIF